MADPGPLFCPFCRECFEGEEVCPDHELPLVTFDDLPRPAGVDLPRDDERVAMYEIRLGRGLLLAAALLTVIGFSLPFITTTVYEPLGATGFEVASRVAPYLWAVPLVGAAWVSILARRRTPRQMRSMRVAVPVLAVIGATAIVYAISRIERGAVEMAEQRQVPVDVQLEVGVWVMAAALGLGALAALRLGVLPPRAELPSDFVDDEDLEDRIDVSDRE